jgi:hypothetical protein
MFKFLKSIFCINKNDPFYKCKLYRNEGCSHIDGILCDFPKCEINREYINKLKK